jgi:hypothetical protein
MFGVYLSLFVLALIVGFVARLAWDAFSLECRERSRLEDEVRYLDRRVSALEQLCHRKPRYSEEIH